MTLIVTISDSETKNSQTYRADEAPMHKILMPEILIIAKVIVSGKDADEVLGLK